MDSQNSFQQMMDRLRKGEDAAASQLVGRFSRRLAALARGRLNGQIRQKEDPEDVLQSVFKSFFVRHAEGQFEPTGWDSLWTLLTVIAVRKCAHHAKYFRAARRSVDRELPEPDGSATGWEALDREPTPDEAAVVADTVEQLMRGLDERGREVLSLRLQGMLVEDIANEAGCAERTVRRTLDHVKRRLRDLESRGDAEPQ